MTDDRTPTLPPHADPPPGCDAFEQTLSLLDGLLDGADRTAALAHARDCAVCGPLADGWPELSDALHAAFEDAAEAAKPDLRALTDRVMEQLYPPAPPQRTLEPKRGLVDFIRRAQGWLLLGATAAALALVVPSLLGGPQGEGLEVAETQGEPPVMVVRDLAFGADTSGGMVYRTPRGGMTVIWVTENEGA